MASENTARTQYNKWLQTEFAAALAHRLVQAAKKKTPLASSEEAEMIKKCQLVNLSCTYALSLMPAAV